MRTAVTEKKTEAACLNELRDLEAQVCDVATASQALLDLFEHHVFPLREKKAELNDDQVNVLSFMIGEVLHRAEKLQENYYSAGWPEKGGVS